MKAYSYIRTTADQRPDAQRAAINAFAAREGVTIVDEYHDHGPDAAGIGAAMRRLREAVEGGRVGVVIVMSADRIGRDSALIGEFVALCRRCGVRLLTVNTGLDVTADDLARFVLDMAAAADLKRHPCPHCGR